jgi:CheY-like chemotaxis protein
MLEQLCQPGLKLDPLACHSLRFLTVDDDVICRSAVSLALKKAFHPPDQAESGDSALTLATHNAYDVIFLDVQMEGMDGFELCSKIHQTAANQDTPVVFVTSMGDFDARAQSVLSGGSDLLGKPFLTFEISVKALTLALRRRINSRSQPAAKGEEVEKTVPLNDDRVSGTAPTAPPETPQTSNQASVMRQEMPEPSLNTDRLSRSIASANLPRTTVSPAGADQLEQAFFARATNQLASLQDFIRRLSNVGEEFARQELLADLYLALNALIPKVDSALHHPAMRMTVALEGLVKKLLENPENWTASAAQTFINALKLMTDLCVTHQSTSIAANLPIRILVVDDDLISRRAIVGALQMAFTKPDSVASGEAALEFAQAKPYDLIFMDKQMPGMDGFTACTKIRQTQTNGNTPVVFITGETNAQSHRQATACGGDDLIAKPFLTAELVLKALTFALRSRIQKSTPLAPSPTAPEIPTAKSSLKSRRNRKHKRARTAVA